MQCLCVNAGSSSLKLARDLFAYQVREAVCEHLGYLGIMDPQANNAHRPVISRSGGACCVEIVPTDEDAMIALHVRELLGDDRP